jgi:hypothetical protein
VQRGRNEKSVLKEKFAAEKKAPGKSWNIFVLQNARKNHLPPAGRKVKQERDAGPKAD